MRYLIIGATGTMGKLVVEALAKDPENYILGMSRDEQKIIKMPKVMNVNYTIGDIRDKSRVQSVMADDYDVVINLSALKCVDIIESNPFEAVKTNIIGSQNLIEAAEMKVNRPKIIFTSTDKAAYPINAYGQSKAIAESLYRQYRGPCTVFRYGNILGSRGSVLHKFVKQILDSEPVSITGLYMSRFWIRDDNVCRILANEATDLTYNNHLKIIFSKTMKIYDVAMAVSKVMGRKYDPRHYNLIGFRPGEKLHETLVANFEDYMPVLADGLNVLISKNKDHTSQEFQSYEPHEFMELIDPIVARILGEK